MGHIYKRGGNSPLQTVGACSRRRTEPQWPPFPQGISAPIVMRHFFRQDDGKLNQSADDLFGVVLIPWRLVNQFLLSLLGNRVDIGRGIVQKMTDDLLRARVMASHKVAATGVAVHFDAAVVLVKDFAVLRADGDGQIEAFVVVFVFHFVLILSAKIE